MNHIKKIPKYIVDGMGVLFSQKKETGGLSSDPGGSFGENHHG